MKNLVKIFILFFVVASTACNENDVTEPIPGAGEVSFSFDIAEQENGRKAGRVEAATPNQIVVSIIDDTGQPVYTQEQLNVVSLNGSFISEPISLQVGSYQLTEYFVQDADGNVIYIAPLENSDLSHLVVDPLSIDFTISLDDSKQIAPEVVSTEGVDAEDFGYTDFSFNIVATFDFLMSVHILDAASSSYELTNANVQILGDGSTELYNAAITNETDQIRIRDGFANYTLVISKPGFEDLSIAKSNGELKGHLLAPLIVLLSPEVLQIDVDASINSSTGGQGISAGSYEVGDILQFSADINDTWSLVPDGSLETNADGKIDIVATINGQTFQTGALVGSFDGGNTYFLIGTSSEVAVSSNTELTLYCWDSDFENNTGAIALSITKIQ